MFTLETLTRLTGAFVKHAKVYGKLPKEVMVVVSEYRYITPTHYPPKKPERQLLRERELKFKVVLPVLLLNSGFAAGTEQSEKMKQDYWGEVAEAVVKDVSFVLIPPEEM